jgi:hypothetical protein
MYSNAVQIIRSFCIANGHPISTGPLKWHEIEAYASVGKAQYFALPNNVKVSLANQFTEPTYIPAQQQTYVLSTYAQPVPPEWVAQIEAYQADPLPGS